MPYKSRADKRDYMKKYMRERRSKQTVNDAVRPEQSVRPVMLDPETQSTHPMMVGYVPPGKE